MSQWTPNTAAWQAMTRFTTFYDSLNRPFEVVKQAAANPSGWIEVSKNLYSYNQTDSLLKDEFFFWNTMDSAWAIDRKQEFTYDLSGRLILQEGSVWDGQLNALNKTIMLRWEYDSVGTTSAYEVYSFWPDTVNLIRSGFREEYSCSMNLTLKPFSNQPSISVFPNPLEKDQTLTIVSDQASPFTIYNQWGQKIAEGRLEKGEKKLWLNNLPTGFYHLCFQDNKVKLLIK
jgi:hypothetical protein